MEILFWLVVLYYVGRRWAKRHPEKAALFKKAFQESRPDKRTELLMKAATEKPNNRPTTPTHAAAKPHPDIKVRKKSEKQFQEL